MRLVRRLAPWMLACSAFSLLRADSPCDIIQSAAKAAGCAAQESGSCHLNSTGIDYINYSIPCKPDTNRCIVMELPTCDPITDWVNCTVAASKLSQACTVLNQWDDSGMPYPRAVVPKNYQKQS